MTDNARRRVLLGAAGLPLVICSTLRSGLATAETVLHQVDIQGFKFVPGTLDVRPGDSITWTNRDLAPHTATAKAGDWDTGPIERGQSVTLTVAPDMSADYFCAFHPAMNAKVTSANPD